MSSRFFRFLPSFCLGACSLVSCPDARAQQSPAGVPNAPNVPSEVHAAGGENVHALPGLLSLALPHSGASPLAIGLNGGAGLYPPVRSVQTGSWQAKGSVAIGVSPLPFLSARLSLRGDLNLHSGGDTSLYGEPEVALRGHAAVTERLRLGAELEARFVGASAPSIDWSATTPTLRGMASYSLSARWLAALDLGFRLDRSAEALGDVSRLNDADRTMLSASSFNAVEVGLGTAHRRDRWEFLAEVGAEVLVGSGAPKLWNAPIWLGLGARYDLLRQLNLFGQVEVSPSARPDPYPSEVLIATRARVSGVLGFTLRFGLPKPPSAAPTQPTPVLVSSPEMDEPGAEADDDAFPSAVVSGRVVDEGGRALPDVQVVLQPTEGEPLTAFSSADGTFQFESIPLGTVVLSAKTPGFESGSEQLQLGEDGISELEMTLYEAVPAGQLRGRVLDFQGRPVPANVTITPGQPDVDLDGDGSFSVDLKPGRYTIRFSAEGYGAQVRSVRIRDKGVVVLNIALEK